MASSSIVSRVCESVEEPVNKFLYSADYREFNKPMGFPDYGKSFESIKWDELLTMLYDMGAPQYLPPSFSVL